MTFAISLRFDKSTEALIDVSRGRMHSEFNSFHRPADEYAPHVTLGIFEALDSTNAQNAIRELGKSAHSVSVYFGGIGIFGGPSGFTIFLNVVPSEPLLLVHRKMHKLFWAAVRRDAFYDIDRWVPHCTVAAGVPTDSTLKRVYSSIPEQLSNYRAEVSRIELLFTQSVDNDPVEILYSHDVTAQSTRNK